MQRTKKLYLPYAAWPEDDRARWETAFKAGNDLFDDQRPAAHLSEPTRLALQYAYGKFLAFLAARHRELLDLAPAKRLSREIIKDYVKWQPATCGGTTLGIYLHHLWMTLRYICPLVDWSWLLIISKRIAAKVKHKPEKHHLVTSETLYALGVEMMDRVILCGMTATTRTRQNAYRDGLIIALLALIPLRRRTLAALRIGKHLIRSADLWALDIPAEDVKTKRPLEYPISSELAGYIDVYLNEIRLRIPGAKTHDYLWPSSRGRPMSDRVIYGAVRRRTRKALGVPVTLQRFRSAAATLWSSRDPANVRGAKDILGHASLVIHWLGVRVLRAGGRSLCRTRLSNRIPC
jgi:integrase/recombinase XerD